MLRELKEWTQDQLAAQSGLHAKNISLLENGRIDIGNQRAEQLAKHPNGFTSRQRRVLSRRNKFITKILFYLFSSTIILPLIILQNMFPVREDKKFAE